MPEQRLGSINQGQINPITCVAECKKQFKFAGIQNDGSGSECYCYDSFGRYDVTSPYFCTITCPGSQGGNCGGYAHNIVFYTDGVLSKWKVNQPDGKRDSGIACTYTTRDDKLEMSDGVCSNLKAALCQKDLDEFVYSNVKYSWCDARNECLRRNMDLAHLNSTEAIENATAFLTSIGAQGNEEFWVGASRQSWRIKEIDEYITYSNWSVCEPTGDLHKSKKECVTYNLATGEWKAEICTQNLGVICATG